MLIDDDESLFARWCGGDRRAAQQLAQRYYKYLSRFFERRAHGNTEDLVQQTLLSVLAAGVRFRGESTFRAYLLGTARNQLYRHARQSKREVADPLECDISTLGTLQFGFEARDDPAEYTWLDGALARVSADAREVVKLAFWDGLTAPEIADATGVPLNTVYSRLRRAKRQLRRQYGCEATDARACGLTAHCGSCPLSLAPHSVLCAVSSVEGREPAANHRSR